MGWVSRLGIRGLHTNKEGIAYSRKESLYVSIEAESLAKSAQENEATGTS